MDPRFSQTPEQLLEEIAFWRDFISWWEHKHARPVEPRAREALEDARRRYRSATRSRECNGVRLESVPAAQER
jgi:hypothetical protein